MTSYILLYMCIYQLSPSASWSHFGILLVCKELSQNTAHNLTIIIQISLHSIVAKGSIHSHLVLDLYEILNHPKGTNILQLYRET